MFFELKVEFCTKLFVLFRFQCGTPVYVAPEMLDPRTSYSFEVDVWAIGIMIYTLLVGKTPFESDNAESLFSNIRMGSYSYPDDLIISDAAKDLIQKILKVYPCTFCS